MTHKKHFLSALALTGLTMAAFAGIQHPAQASSGPGQAVHINADGRQICRSLAGQGPTYWEAKIRGRFLDSYAGNNRFVVKTCFETRAACLSYAGGIRHHIQGVETVSYARCTAK